MKLIKKTAHISYGTGAEVTLQELLEQLARNSITLWCDEEADGIEIGSSDVVTCTTAGKKLDPSKVKLVFEFIDADYKGDLLRDAFDNYVKEQTL